MKKIFKITCLLTNLLILSVSCKFNFQPPEVIENQKKVKISIVTAFDSENRKAYVENETLHSYYKSLSYSLTMSDEETTTKIFENKIFEDVNKFSDAVNSGKYTFTLSAFDSNSKTQILAGVCQIELSEKNNELVFNMKPVKSSTGTLNLRMNYSEWYIGKNENREKVYYPGFRFYYRTLTKDGLSELTEAKYKCLDETPVRVFDNLFSQTYQFELPVEKYFFYVEWGYPLADGTNTYKYVGDELVYISPNQTVYADITVNKTWKFFKNVWDKENYRYNFDLERSLVELDKNFNRVLKAGEAVKVKFSGYSESDFSGSMDFTFADNYNGWKSLGNSKIKVDLFADEYFSYSTVILLNDSARILEYQDLAIFYDADDYDDELRLYNVEYEFEYDIETVKYTYHLGGLSYPAAVLSGESYILPEETFLEDHGLIGWYDNAELQGEPVTVISAEQNTINRNFYAKYNYIIKQWDTSGWRSMNIYFKEYNLAPPKPNQIVTLKMTVVPSNTFEPRGFSSDLSTWAPNWNPVSNDYRTYLLEKDKPLEMRFDYLIPADFDASILSGDTSIGIAVGTDCEEDWPFVDCQHVTIEYSDFSTSFENQNVSAKALSDGIHFTIAKKSVQGKWSNLVVKDKTTDMYYTFKDNFDSEEFQCVYPYVTENKNYNFEISYNQEIPSSGKQYFITQKVFINSTGVTEGKGELDYSAYKNLSISLTDDSNADQEHRYMTVNNYDETAIKEIFVNEPDAVIGWSVWGGESWNWIFGSDAEIFNEKYDEKNFYAQILQNGKFDIIPLLPDDKIEMLSNYSKYWTTIMVNFNSDESGYFTFQNIESPKTVYVPVGETCKVTFMDKSNAYTTIRVLKGGTVPEEFTLPNKQYEDFVGWYYEPECKNDYSFNDKITEDTVIYSLWRTHSPASLSVDIAYCEDVIDDICVNKVGNEFVVTISTDEDHNNTIYYTLDGSTPTEESSVYRNPILIEDPSILKVFVKSDYYIDSALFTKSFAFQLPEVGFNNEEGEYSTGTAIVLSSSVVGSSIYYTTDGSTPTVTSTLYTDPITISSDMTIKAIAVKEGYISSDVVGNSYTIKNFGMSVTFPTIVTADSVIITPTEDFVEKGTEIVFELDIDESIEITSVNWFVNNELVSLESTFEFDTTEFEGITTITCRAYDSSQKVYTGSCSVIVAGE